MLAVKLVFICKEYVILVCYLHGKTADHFTCDFINMHVWSES